MTLWDRLRGLELNVEEFSTERKSVEVSSEFTRVETLKSLLAQVRNLVIGIPGVVGRKTQELPRFVIRKGGNQPLLYKMLAGWLVKGHQDPGATAR